MDDNSTIKKIIKYGCVGLGSFAVWYYSGPIIQELVRYGYTEYYDYRYGIPELYEWDYWTTFFPARGHLSGLAYQYGNTICTVAVMPLLTKIMNLVMGTKTQPLSVVVEQSENPPVLFSKHRHEREEQEHQLEKTGVNRLVAF